MEDGLISYPEELIRTRTTEHITPVLKTLHWLPVHQRIVYKILLLTFKILHDLAPSYLTELLSLKMNATRSLRSDSQNLLIVPKSRTVMYGDRDFRNASPRLWNDLPLHLRLCHSLPEFKQLLKTHLFIKAYS